MVHATSSSWEGFRLLPHRVAPLTTSVRCLWLLPTLALRRAALAERGDIHAITGRTSDPQRALEHLLTRDRTLRIIQNAVR